MSEPTSTLYAKLLGETARIQWKELQPFFARGALLWVNPERDLIAVAETLAKNDHVRVAAWLKDGTLEKMSAPRAMDYVERDPGLWAVVVSPWVVIQERAAEQ